MLNSFMQHRSGLAFSFSMDYLWGADTPSLDLNSATTSANDNMVEPAGTGDSGSLLFDIVMEPSWFSTSTPSAAPLTSVSAGSEYEHLYLLKQQDPYSPPPGSFSDGSPNSLDMSPGQSVSDPDSVTSGSSAASYYHQEQAVPYASYEESSSDTNSPEEDFHVVNGSADAFKASSSAAKVKSFPGTAGAARKKSAAPARGKSPQSYQPSPSQYTPPSPAVPQHQPLQSVSDIPLTTSASNFGGFSFNTGAFNWSNDQGNDYDLKPIVGEDGGDGMDEDGEGGDEEAFKQRHNASERKRQAVINNAITTLKSLVFLGPSGKRLAKGAVLKKAVDHIQLQNSHAARLRKENDYLKRENQNLFKHVHLLRAVLVSNNLSAPAYHSVPLVGFDNSMPGSDSSTSGPVLDSSDPPSTSRRVAAVAALLVFCASTYIMSTTHIVIDSHSFATRALQAFSLRDDDQAGDVDKMVYFWAHSVMHNAGDFVFLMFMGVLRIEIVFVIALVIKQLLEPVLDASDPALAVAQHYATVSDSCYRTGSCAEATKESAEGLKALALYIDASKINTIWKALPLFGGVAYELMRHITHRMRIGLWADSTIVQVRGAEKYYMDIANLSFLQGQSLYYGNMYEGMSLYRSLAIMYYMLLAMNTSEAVGRSAMPLFAHISMSIAWMLTLGNNGWLYYVKQGLVKAYRRLAWQMSSFGSGKESTETVGRYYQHVGAEKFAQGQLRDAAFNFAHALELYQLANMKLYWHVTGNMLALVYVFQEEIDKANKVLNELNKDLAVINIDNRKQEFTQMIRAVLLISQANTRSDNRRVYSALFGSYQKAKELHAKVQKNNDALLPWRLVIPLALCSARCGDIKEANAMIAVYPDIVGQLSVTFSDTMYAEFYTELLLFFLEAKMHDAVVAKDLPPLEDIEKNVKTALGKVLALATIFAIYRPVHLMIKARYNFIHGRFTAAKAELVQAQTMLKSMGMPSYLRRATCAIEDLDRHINLQKNFSDILALQV